MSAAFPVSGNDLTYKTRKQKVQHSLSNAVGWLTRCRALLCPYLTLLCQGGVRVVSQEASLRPNQLVREDFMWRATGRNSLVYSPLLLAMIIVGKEADAHADFAGCLQDLNSLAVLNILEIHIIHS